MAAYVIIYEEGAVVFVYDGTRKGISIGASKNRL